MLYDITQTMEYLYEEPVGMARHILRMTPTDRPGQRVLAAETCIEPEPRRLVAETDFFGNRLIRIEVATPHDRLIVASRAQVAVDPPLALMADLSPAWEAARDHATQADGFGPEAPAHFLFPGRMTPDSPAIRAWAAASFPPGRPILAAVAALNLRFREEFAYDPEATDAATLPPDAFAARRGVCQDFAHVMIVALRGLGLAAGYVSGYLRTTPPPGQPRLVGADATHAWARVWCGSGIGWRGFDPTNGVETSEDHVVVAVGRDYADVSPIDGVILSSGAHSLSVAVDVAPAA